MPNPDNCLPYWDLADHIRIDDATLPSTRKWARRSKLRLCNAAKKAN